MMTLWLLPMLFLDASGPSPVVFPPQSIPLTFSHTKHLKRNIACDYCHAKASDSTDARDFLIPSEDQCTDCHPIDRAQPTKQTKIPSRCDACHPGFTGEGQPQRVSVPTPHLKFN